MKRDKRKDKRKVRMMFHKGGTGSTTTRVSIPKVWADEMGITPDCSEVIIELEGKEIRVRKMTNAEKLIEKIDNVINETIMKTGKMGRESVRVGISLTEEEREIFYDIDKYDNEHYAWEIEELELYITYTEDVK